MGNCNSAQVDKSLEADDPPIAIALDGSGPPAAPFTVDLHNPPVVVDASLNSRDIDLVQQTFARAALLGTDTVGWVLFMNIFRIAPEAKNLFPFKDEADLASSARMKAHGSRVVATVATAVSLLHDLDTLVPVLQSLGLRHAGYSVRPEHYDVVGEALIIALETALGPNMTPAVTNAYLKVFTIIKNTMIEKCDYQMEQPSFEETASSSASPPVAEAPAATEPKILEDAAAPAEAVEATPPIEEAAAAKAEDGNGQDSMSSSIEQANGEDHHKKKQLTESKPKTRKLPDHASKTKSSKEVASKAKPKAASAGITAKEEESKEKAVEEPQTKDGPSPDEQLLAATAGGDDKLVAKLLKAGANINFADSDGKTALHIAAEKGVEEIVSRLSKDKKVKINTKTVSTKDTALHLACREGHRECAVLLVKGGADLSIKNKTGKFAANSTTDSQLSNWLQSGKSGAGGGAAPPWQQKK